jgi:hypothetical protein
MFLLLNVNGYYKYILQVIFHLLQVKLLEFAVIVAINAVCRFVRPVRACVRVRVCVCVESGTHKQTRTRPGVINIWPTASLYVGPLTYKSVTYN